MKRADVVTPRDEHRGRPRYRPQQCLEGILYVLLYDIPWADLPYNELGVPSGETCRRRLEEWIERGLFAQVIAVLHAELAAADRLDWSRLIVDCSTVDAKKGARRSRAPSKAPLAAVCI